jgi:hypothetical protein
MIDEVISMFLTSSRFIEEGDIGIASESDRMSSRLRWIPWYTTVKIAQAEFNKRVTTAYGSMIRLAVDRGSCFRKRRILEITSQK